MTRGNSIKQAIRESQKKQEKIKFKKMCSGLNFTKSFP